jgi:hypothetical protein
LSRGGSPNRGPPRREEEGRGGTDLRAGLINEDIWQTRGDTRGKESRKFPRARGKAGGDAREGDAEWDARAEGFDGNLLKMATSFGTLLESKFSCFAKFSRITTSFGKL